MLCILVGPIYRIPFVLRYRTLGVLVYTGYCSGYWLNYSEVRGGELYIGQNYSATPKPL